MMSSDQKGRDGVGMAFVVVAAVLVLVLVALAFGRTPSPATREPLAANAASDPGGAAAPSETSGDLQVLAVADPEDAATAYLATEYGVVCTNASDVLIQEDPGKVKDLDTKIDAMGSTDGWIDEGSTYVGDGVDAAEAFNASKAFGDDSSIWIVVAGDKPQAVELRSVQTPAGNTVWAIANWVTPC